jgi:predicted HAD superfamily Cof-like phosphohydrolase
MRDEIEKVRQFHRKNGFADGEAFRPPTAPMRARLDPIVDDLALAGRELLAHSAAATDPGDWLLAMRCHLVVEEAGEFVEAVRDGDPVKAVDALADLCYVALGTDVAYGWQLAAVFDEVHASNMTKERQPSDPHSDRCRDKGPWYVPPDVAGAVAGRVTLLRSLSILAERNGVSLLELLKDPSWVRVRYADDAVGESIGALGPEGARQMGDHLRAFLGHPRLTAEGAEHPSASAPGAGRGFRRGDAAAVRSGPAVGSAEAGGALGSELETQPEAPRE